MYAIMCYQVLFTAARVEIMSPDQYPQLIFL